MYKKILVTLDGSRLSEAVLPYARAFARALKIPVELLQVIDPESVRILADPSLRYEQAEAEARRNGLACLKKATETFSDIGAAQFSLETGNTAEVILNKAESESGTLIAMATHGRSGLQRWLLGSVAYKVVSAAACPLLLVRATEGMKTSGVAELKNVFVPLDGSDLAELALPHAIELAKEIPAQLVLARVYDPHAYGNLPRMGELIEELRIEAEVYLEKKARQLKAEGIDDLCSMVLKGYPAAEIVDAAQELPESLITITTHGRSGAKRWLLGSVTERVIRHAGCPVLIVRASPAA
jgi:nucleotide-binding universal stress UspA family protein